MKCSRIVAVLIVIVATWFSVVSLRMNSNNERIIQSEQKIPATIDTAVVLGTVIEDKVPPLQEERLDLAAQLFFRDQIDRLIISNTEEASQKMVDYLIDQHVPEEVIEVDDAALMTSDTCNYLANIGGSYVLITQEFHLKRTLYLCRDAGVEVYGYAAENAGTIERNNSIRSYTTRLYRFMRERTLMSLHLVGLYK